MYYTVLYRCTTLYCTDYNVLYRCAAEDFLATDPLGVGSDELLVGGGSSSTTATTTILTTTTRWVEPGILQAVFGFKTDWVDR